jgi:hypothetical protein
MVHRCNDIERKNRRAGRIILPSVTLSTTNPKWTDLGANPGFCDKNPASNRVRYGTAIFLVLHIKVFGSFS